MCERPGFAIQTASIPPANRSIVIMNRSAAVRPDVPFSVWKAGLLCRPCHAAKEATPCAVARSLGSFLLRSKSRSPTSNRSSGSAAGSRRPIAAKSPNRMRRCEDNTPTSRAVRNNSLQTRGSSSPLARPCFTWRSSPSKPSRLVYEVLQQAEHVLRSGDAWIVSPEVVERGIDWNRRQLLCLEGQQRLLDLADEVILPLNKLFVQLEGSRHVSSLGWRSIARHLLSRRMAGMPRPT